MKYVLSWLSFYAVVFDLTSWCFADCLGLLCRNTEWILDNERCMDNQAYSGIMEHRHCLCDLRRSLFSLSVNDKGKQGPDCCSRPDNLGSKSIINSLNSLTHLLSQVSQTYVLTIQLLTSTQHTCLVELNDISFNINSTNLSSL